MRRCTLFLLAILTISPRLLANELRVGLMDGIGPPYDTGAGNGLAMTIALDLSAEIGADGVTLSLLPRNRIYLMLAAGRLDIVLPSNPSWVEDTTGITWSSPIYTVSDRLYMRRGAASSVRGLEALHGRRVGTLLGYRYPADWIRAFNSGSIIREDVVTKEQNIGKLLSGRIDAFIAEDIIMRHLYALRPELEDAIEAAPFIIERYDIAIAISTRGRFSAAVIEAALHRLRSKRLYWYEPY